MPPTSPPRCRLPFSLNPVQEFITAARTVRDLWTGSYLVSWLTAQALAAAARQGALESENPLAKLPLVPWLRAEPRPALNLRAQGGPQELLSCLPNTFDVEVPDGVDAAGLAQALRDAVQGEWMRISKEVRGFLNTLLSAKFSDWDEGWDAQVEQFWQIGVQVLPGDADLAPWRGLLPAQTPEANVARALLGRLEALSKAQRHYPCHEPKDETRPKNSLTGDRAQMGPRAEPYSTEDPMMLSREFWEQAAELFEQGRVQAQSPERIRKQDRFDAVGLIKRFAWQEALAPRLGVEPDVKRVPDTATVAARVWLHALGPLDADAAELVSDYINRGRRWSGQWLHWATHDADKDEDACPQQVWATLRKLKELAKSKGLGGPPAYYAIVMLDGDGLGKKLQASKPTEQREISAKLGEFAVADVPRIVDEHRGFLVYGGGDDVLALLPTATALKCCLELHRAFAERLPGLSISAGLAVAHYKFDLRDALEAARQAEKAAKDGGRNQLVVRVLRRSGEHTSARLEWGCVAGLQALVEEFRGAPDANEVPQRRPATDRWSYQLRGTMQQMLGPDEERWPKHGSFPEMVDAELGRLLERTADGCAPAGAQALWAQLVGTASDRAPAREPRLFRGAPLKARANALTLMQTASFLARGRE